MAYLAAFEHCTHPKVQHIGIGGLLIDQLVVDDIHHGNRPVLSQLFHPSPEGVKLLVVERMVNPVGGDEDVGIGQVEGSGHISFFSRINP